MTDNKHGGALSDTDLTALIAASEAATPAWGVWVDYTLAPRGSYACLMSSFVDGKWTTPEDVWMPAQMRPQLRGKRKVMPYLMPGDPLAEHLACNNAAEMARELIALRRQIETLQGSHTIIAKELADAKLKGQHDE